MYPFFVLFDFFMFFSAFGIIVHYVKLYIVEKYNASLSLHIMYRVTPILPKKHVIYESMCGVGNVQPITI